VPGKTAKAAGAPRRKQAQHPRRETPPAANWARLAVLTALTAVVAIVIAAKLHSRWIGLLWLGAIALWGWYWFDRPNRTSAESEPPAGLFTARLLVVLLAAGFFRLYKISELPLGPSADEIFTLNNTIEILSRPFDLFGQTPLFIEGWVETTHLYLYFNLLIVTLFGVSYWSMKLFSVLPGIVACAILFVLCRRLVGERIAFWSALIFASAHWPVRLSRYGWDVSFMLMTFALALALLLAAFKNARALPAYLAGAAAGLGLYSYLGARICAFSLLAGLLLEAGIRRERAILRQSAAFATGLALVAFPLLCYYLAHPAAYGVRTGELSVFNGAAPFATMAENIWRHALMLFVRGGVYARDNFPGLPMLDPLTGLVCVAGLAAALRRIHDAEARLLLAALSINFAGGIFSVSQEGAPYVYRTAAVTIPAFAIAGMGLQWIAARAATLLPSRQCNFAAWPVLLVVMALNFYLYFDLEARNAAAMRVMAYEPRLLGLEIARDDLPVLLIGAEVFVPAEGRAVAGEEYASANPPVILPPAIRRLATIAFSGRYDVRRTMTENFQAPRAIYFTEAESWQNAVQTRRPAKLIFRPNREIEAALRADDPRARIGQIRNIRGETLYTVAIVENPQFSRRPAGADAVHRNNGGGAARHA